jgi:hypothetical protein
MARVIQQRSNPPYLLIVMVFLFLVSAALAVYMYIENDKTQKQLAESQDQLDTVINQTQSRQMRPQIEAAAKQRATLVGLQSDQIEQLQSQIALAGSPEAAIAEAEAVKEQIMAARGTQTWGGLVSELQAAWNQSQSLREQNQQLQEQLTQKTAEVVAMGESHKQAVNEITEKLKAAEARVEAADRAVEAAQENYRQELAKGQQQWAARQEELNANIAQKTRQLQDLQAVNAQLKREIDRIMQDLRQNQPQADAIQVARKPDGKILRTAEDSICYLNLGSEDNIVNGMTFEVYPRTGIPTDGEGKGSVIVTRAFENISECKIVENSTSDPVRADDLVANLAYDPNRTFTFAVEGEFDLYASGQTASGADEVKRLIRRYGGRVADEVTVQTDFVVMGNEPARPKELDESAEPQMWKVYNEKLAEYNRYTQLRQTAQSLNIPVLNTTRFLAFMGYTPAESLSR